MKPLRWIAALLISILSIPTAAQAVDIPLLTWERGRVQQVVLGGGAYTAQWDVTLEGNGINPLNFIRSDPNDAGFIVYSLEIPSDLPVGAYTVKTTGANAPSTIVAGIDLVQSQTKTATSNLIDLTEILAIFIFLITFTSTLRAQKYSKLTNQSSQFSLQGDEYGFVEQKSFLERLRETPYRIRINGLQAIRISLLQFLMVREGELVHRISRELFGLLPLLGLLAGIIAGAEVNKNSSIGETGIPIFVAITILAVFDAYSGLIATLGFWLVQLLTGHVTSVRDVLIMLSVGLTWVGTSLFAGLLKENFAKDFRFKSKNVSVTPYGVIASALVGSVIFYFGHALIDSILYVESTVREISVGSIAIVALAITVKGIAELAINSKNDGYEGASEEFIVARVCSPQSASLLSLITFGFLYIWTENAGRSLIFSLMFTLPFYLVFMSFGEGFALLKRLPPRNLLLESAGVALISILGYQVLSGRPILLGDKANFLLLISAIPAILHAVYSAIYAESEKKEIIRG